MLADTTSGDILVWSVILLVLIVFGLAVALQVKRRALDDSDEAPVGLGFTLSDLRQMRKSGKLTDEEFERAKAKMIAGAKAPPPAPGRPAGAAPPSNRAG